MITIYHNPKCSKSRKTLELILNKTKEVQIIEYLKDIPTLQDLKEILSKLGLEAIKIIRTKEKEFQEYNQKDLSEEELLKLIALHPTLLERPIVTLDDKAIIGRPPENVLELLK